MEYFYQSVYCDRAFSKGDFVTINDGKLEIESKYPIGMLGVDICMPMCLLPWQSVDKVTITIINRGQIIWKFPYKISVGEKAYITKTGKLSNRKLGQPIGVILSSQDEGGFCKVQLL